VQSPTISSTSSEKRRQERAVVLANTMRRVLKGIALPWSTSSIQSQSEARWTRTHRLPITRGRSQRATATANNEARVVQQDLRTTLRMLISILTHKLSRPNPRWSLYSTATKATYFRCNRAQMSTVWLTSICLLLITTSFCRPSGAATVLTTSRNLTIQESFWAHPACQMVGSRRPETARSQIMTKTSLHTL